ncbi:MAG: hypothetical protein JWP89_345 [Schlesneria sp.]|nr:hypothetical protein [Schlesneria sp.]
MNSNQSHSKFVGSVSLWRYVENERNYPGWNLSADSLGVASLLSILSELQAVGGHRTIPITSPTLSTLSVPNNNSGKAKWIAPTKWRLIYLSTDEDADAWSFLFQQDVAILSLGRNRMLELIAGIANLPQSVGDFRIGGSNNSAESLWFWRWIE